MLARQLILLIDLGKAKVEEHDTFYSISGKNHEFHFFLSKKGKERLRNKPYLQLAGTDEVLEESYDCEELEYHIKNFVLNKHIQMFNLVHSLTQKALDEQIKKTTKKWWKFW